MQCVGFHTILGGSLVSHNTTGAGQRGVRDTDNLQLWLKNSGQRVEELSIYGAPGTISTIPCPKLPYLVIHDSAVELAPGSQLFNDLTAATQLTALAFRNVVFKDEPDFLALFGALPDLQQLELEQLQVAGSLLQDTSARLLSAHENPHNRCKRFTDSSMKLISQYTKLSHLALHTVRDVTSAGIETLCSSMPALTEVLLSGVTCTIDSSTVTSISTWTSLKSLCLTFVDYGADLDLDVLASMTQLSTLALQVCTVVLGQHVHSLLGST